MTNYPSKKLTLALLVLVLVLVLFVVGGWWLLGRSTPDPHNIRNVVLISIDTCRADYLSCYGYPRKTTPNIDQIAAEGIRFENVISPVPITLPAHSSMLTGTLPPYHGVHDNMDYQLGPPNQTLAEILKDNGFKTAAFVGAFVLHEQFGLAQGFDSYNDHFEETHNSIGINERKAGETSRLAGAWIEEHREENFFLFLHYYDPHKSYEPPDPFAARFSDNPYAGEIAYTDDCIGQVLAKLKQLELYDSTLIIVTSDHGEMLGEHGELTHSYYIYQGVLKVPLVFKLPGTNPTQVVEHPASVVDIVPTICGLLDIAPPSEAGAQGRDLSGSWGVQGPETEKRYLYCESLTPTKYHANSLLGVMGERWKYIQTTRPELYDLVSDPQESVNLVDRQPELVLQLQEGLAQLIEESARQDTSESKRDTNSETLQKLQSLGYVGGSVREDFTFDQDSDDPKDILGIHMAYMEVATLVRREEFGQARRLCEKMLQERPEFLAPHLKLAEMAIELGAYSEALVPLEEVLRGDPDDFYALSNKGVALAGMGKMDEAVEQFREALRLHPEGLEALSGLGAVLAAQGQTEEGLAYLQQALEIDTAYFEGHKNLGIIFLEQGKTDQAVEHFQQMCQLRPDSATVPHRIGVLLAQQGKLQLATGYFQKAIQLDPEHLEAHHMLGVALLQQQKTEEAVEHLQKSIDRETEKPEMLVTIGSVLAEQGKLDLAVAYFSKAVELNPQFSQARHNLAKALLRQGKTDQAVGHYQELLELHPEQFSLHNELAVVFYNVKNYGQAIAHWSESVRLRPDQFTVLNSLAWLKATSQDPTLRNAEEAVELAQRACELSDSQDPVMLDTLAAAYAAAERFDEAVRTAQQAAERARANNNEQLAERIGKRLELYRAGKAYGEPST